MPAQAMTQQATRHARRVYVGGLPLMANEQVGYLSIDSLGVRHNLEILLHK